jgi:cysteine synthase
MGNDPKAHLVLPDDAAVEKPQMMASFGATTRRVRPVSISHPEHYVKIARQRAMDACARDGKGAGYFANQFENAANFRAHLDGTGPEIWRQMGGRRGGVDAFVCAAGTGGTLAGVSRYLRSKDPRVQFFLVDPPGSSLYNKVNRGVMYCKEEAEGTRLKNPFDTITEGVGINRLTANFSIALGGDGSEAGTSAPVEGVEPLETSPIARAFKCSDREAVEMSRYLAREDGLFLGASRSPVPARTRPARRSPRERVPLAGPRANASARRAPFLEASLRPRAFLSAHRPSVSIPTRLDASRLRLTPFDSARPDVCRFARTLPATLRELQLRQRRGRGEGGARVGTGASRRHDRVRQRRAAPHEVLVAGVSREARADAARDRVGVGVFRCVLTKVFHPLIGFNI